jgi:pimeloyl-ACP methyl ester carboxylesterase
MATFAFVPAGGDSAWSWHLVEAALRARRHDTVAVDLPADDESADLWTYADTVARAIGERRNVVVVGHSFGGFTAPLVCTRVACDALVMLTAMIPTPGEPPADWWTNTGHEQARRDAGADADADELETYYHDVPPHLAAEALRRARNHPSDRAYGQPWPLDAWPDGSTHVLACRDDRFFPAAFMRQLARDRLGIEADEIPGGHCVMLSRPAELAERLEAYARRA